MIYCIIGKSASGKDSIYKNLLKRIPSLNKIVIYTTRPKRDNEIDGREYHFVDDLFLDKNQNKIIEKRVYNTVYGPWTYATLSDDTINQNEKYILLATLESYNNLKNYYGKENVFPLYIEVPNDIRYKRAKLREEKSLNPKYEEMERRFKSDEIDFSEENIKKSNISKKYLNIDLEKCLMEIINDINR